MIAACLAFSLHFLAGDWNSIHPCLRLEGERFAAGAFLNSEGRVSLTLGLTLEEGNWWADLGVATGYSGGELVPFLRGGYKVEDKYFFLAPAYNVDKRDFGAVLGVEHRF